MLKKNFRDPQYAKCDNDRILTIEMAIACSEDLDNDLYYLLEDPKKEIIDRLNNGIFTFFAKDNYDIYTEELTNYEMWLNSHENLKFYVENFNTKTERFEGVVYYFHNYGSHDYGQPRNKGYNDQYEKLFNIARTWLAKEDFFTGAELSKKRDLERKNKE